MTDRDGTVRSFEEGPQCRANISVGELRTLCSGIAGRCATCRWAEAATGIWSGDEPPHPLACSLVRDNAQFCIQTQDSGGRDELYVSPMFGCVQWEAKE